MAVIVAVIYILCGVGYIAHYFWELHQLERRINRMENDPIIKDIRRENRENVTSGKKMTHCPHHHTERYDGLCDHCLDCGEYFLYAYLPN